MLNFLALLIVMGIGGGGIGVIYFEDIVDVFQCQEGVVNGLKELVQLGPKQHKKTYGNKCEYRKHISDERVFLEEAIREARQENNWLMQQQMKQENDRLCMKESLEIVTPFDNGGYVQGEGFNPSDTMHTEMNHMNDMF